MQTDSLFHKALTIMMRVTSLAAKLILTLYMGKYLGLSEMGVYGVVFGAVMIICVALGGRLDFVVARDLVGDGEAGVLHKMRDQAVFYFINYLFFAVVMLGLALIGVASPRLLSAIFALSIVESVANMTSTNLVALGHPMLSTFLFFVRAGLWCLVVVALGFFLPSTRNVETILIAWMIGSGLSVLLNLYAWRKMPWAAVMRRPIDWAWIKDGVKKSLPIWLGTMGGVGALHVDRFVVSYYLTLEQVGILTFFGSFAAALLSLVQSGFFAFSYPRLIQHYREKRLKEFWREFHQTSWQSVLFVTLAAGVVGAIVPVLADLLGKTEIAAQEKVLWLMLAAVWVRNYADSLYYVLYARHQDRPNWLGALLFLVPSLGGNIILVPLVGLAGAGYSAIVASVFLLVWRLYFVVRPSLKKK